MGNLFTENKETSFKHRLLNEILSAITHGIGFGLSIAALVLIVIHAVNTGNPIRIVSDSVYGVSMMLFFISSTLFHSLYFTKAKRVFQIFDHASIYLLIAGTYTPYCLVTIGGVFGWTLFGIIWGLALLGIIYKAIWLDKYRNFATFLYVVLGWICIVAFKPLYSNLTSTGFWLLVAGGVVFTIGALIYSIRRIPYLHVIWHIIVMIGVALMYFSILFFV
ncbi:PAQR family membrane homeostasis protein TrhA [Pediococcus claussenii]|nr:hemolysin III family protein [Pediococcus claussenii]ANZ70221.1 hemolysin III [Pediococcus claussenii]ANZ72037.1 hemolysin III [Pediococcus claussenii]KRN19166.1 hypothetical protein IV79_GL001538 [Pediococcus claussenii]